MIGLGISLIVLAGVAEHYKDLSEEGKLKKYPYAGFTYTLRPTKVVEIRLVDEIQMATNMDRTVSII